MANFNLMNEIGATGLNRFGGYVYEEWLSELSGTRGIKVYKQMRDNDPTIGAILFAMKMLIRQVDWKVTPASQAKVDMEAAAFLESCMNDMSVSWHDTITEILTMLVFGWSWHEIVYKRTQEGRIGWRKFAPRAQETFYNWVFNDEGSVIALQQLPPPDYRIREIPIEKSLLFRTESTKGNPEGRSILRNAYRPWYFKSKIEVIEGIGIERDLAGLPVALVPPELLGPDATPSEKAMAESIKKMVTSIRRDECEGVLFPAEEFADGRKTGYKLSLLTSGGKRQFDTNQIIGRYKTEITMTVMADFLMLGHEKVGSFALASSKTDLFSLAIAALLDSIKGVFNTYAVSRLFEVNAFPGLNALPIIEYGDIETPDLTELGGYITALSGAGLVMDESLENYLRTVANLPAKEGAEVKKKEILKARDVEDELKQFKDTVALELDKVKMGFLAAGRNIADNNYDTFWETFGVNIKPHLKRFYERGWEDGQEKLGDAVEVITIGNKAEKWAKERGGELITGLDEATREMVRSTIAASVAREETWEQLQARLMKDHAFGAQRAELIARTESGRALNIGAVHNWRASGLVDRVQVTDGDGCRVCADLKAREPIWTLAQAEARPLQHPRCWREFYPVFNEDEGEPEKDYGTPDWLKRQDKDLQAAFLGGKGKQQMFEAGLLEEKDFGVSLKELQARAGSGKIEEESNPYINPEWVKEVDKLQKPYLEHWAKHYGLTVDEYKAKVTEHIKELVSMADVCIRRKEQTVKKILESGRLKTQFEVSNSRGEHASNKRVFLEEKLFGLSKDIDPKVRPIYGYLTGSIAKDGIVGEYGGAVLKLKDSVKQKTTFSFEDTLGATFDGKKPLFTADLLENPTFRAGVFAEYDIEKGISVVKEDPLMFKTINEIPPYAEAQIHNGVTLDDIEEIIFTEKLPDNKTKELLKQHNVKWSLGGRLK